LTLQGKYASLYKKAAEGVEISSVDINAEGIITNRLDEAFQINE
jgi:hypothetical protein